MMIDYEISDSASLSRSAAISIDHRKALESAEKRIDMKFQSKLHLKSHSALAKIAFDALQRIASEYDKLAKQFADAKFDECAEFYSSAASSASKKLLWYASEAQIKQANIARLESALSKLKAEKIA